MKLIHLFENNVHDVATKGLKTFLDDCKQNSNQNLFVVFSDNKRAEFHNNGGFDGSMVAYPVKYVIDNSIKFASLKTKFITVISLNNSGVDINTVRLRDVENVAKKIFFNTGNIEYHSDNIHKLISAYKSKYNKKYLTIMYKDLIKKLPLKERPDFVYDNSDSTFGVLSSDAGSIAYIFNRFCYKYATHYYNDNKKESVDSSKRTIRKLAAKVSEGLGTKLSSDKEIRVFTESIFWTLDGIEIHITELYSSQSTSAVSEYDGTYYIIECDTPNGYLVYNTTPDETFDHTKNEIQKRSKSLNRPNTNWVQKSRDLYLTGTRYGTKMFDEDKDKYIETVNKFYPKMREFALRNNIQIKDISGILDIEKITIFNIMERFLIKQPEPLVAIKNVKDKNASIDELFGHSGLVSGSTITFDFLYKMALVYSIARKIAPNRTGWHIYNYVGML